MGFLHRHIAIIVVVLLTAGGLATLYPNDPLGLRLSCSPAADLTADPSTYTWTDITKDLQLAVPITHMRGAQDEQSESNSETSLALRDNQGRYNSDNPMSDLYPNFGLGTPLRLESNTGDGTGWHQEWIQFIAEESQDWPDGTPYLCNTHLTAAGIFRRLGQGKRLQSAMFRTVTKTSPAPILYLPMEDGQDATQFLSGLTGGPAAPFKTYLEPSGADDGSRPLPQPGTVTVTAGSKPVAGFEATTAHSVSASFGTVTISGASAGFIGLTLLFEGQPPSTPHTLSWQVCNINFSGGTIAARQIVSYTDYTAGAYVPALRQFGVGGVVGTTNFDPWDGLPHVAHIRMIQNGGNVDYSIYVDGVLNGTASAAGTLGTPVSLDGPNPVAIDFGGGNTGDATGSILGLGQIVLHDNSSVSAATMYNGAIGWAGEQAHNRHTRFGLQQGIPTSTTAVASTLMGPEPEGSALDIFRDIEATDHGQMDDSQGKIVYRALSEYYNQTARVTINGGQPQRLFSPFPAITDDQKRRNVVTASRPNGSSITATNAADVIKHGEFDHSIQPNVQTDLQLPDHAGWFAYNIGVVNSKRVSQLRLDLLVANDLIADMRTARLGDRITVINPPRQLSRNDIDVIMPGWSTTIEGRGRSYQMVFNCDPYDPYRVAALDNVSLAKIDSGTSTLTSAITATDLSISITTSNAGDLWTLDAAECPIPIIVNGERMTVSAVTGATSPQTFTVLRSVNGAVKSHAAGSEVHVYLPARSAL